MPEIDKSVIPRPEAPPVNFDMHPEGVQTAFNQKVALPLYMAVEHARLLSDDKIGNKPAIEAAAETNEYISRSAADVLDIVAPLSDSQGWFDVARSSLPPRIIDAPLMSEIKEQRTQERIKALHRKTRNPLKGLLKTIKQK